MLEFNPNLGGGCGGEGSRGGCPKGRGEVRVALFDERPRYKKRWCLCSW